MAHSGGAFLKDLISIFATSVERVFGAAARGPDVIPEAYVDIFESEAFGHLTTLMPGGSPQATPVWVDHDGREAVLVNTARGRRKEKNIRRDPRVSISVVDPENPYRFVSVRGEATLTEEGAVDHIDALARRYMDVEEYPNHGEESGPRVVVRIPADEVATGGE